MRKIQNLDYLSLRPSVHQIIFEWRGMEGSHHHFWNSLTKTTALGKKLLLVCFAVLMGTGCASY